MSLINWVEKGVCDVVDILHLPFIQDIVSETCNNDKLMEMFANRKVASYAYECLERIRLLVRKQCTARANCVLMQSCPYTNDMNTNTDDCLDIVPFLDRLMEAPRHKDIYQALDGAWIDTEGKLRMLTALASGLLMLLEKGLASQNHQNVDSGCDWSEWFVFLDELTLYLLGCCGSYTHPSPQFH